MRDRGIDRLSNDRSERGGRRRELSRPQEKALRDVASFRVVDVRDLSKRDLRSLKRRGLVETRSIPSEDGILEVAFATERGRRVSARTIDDGYESARYAGLVKRREVAHDSAVYRMFRAYEKRIRRSGGRVRRVLLDHEFKRRLYSRVNRGVPKERAAREVGLRIVENKIPLPDLRIEYETASGRRARVDLELATSHYKPGQRAEKRAAGFVVHMSEDFASEGGSRRDRLAAEIFSL